MIINRREDWMLFCSMDTLAQKAGVSRNMIPYIVFKELLDNALDAVLEKGEEFRNKVRFQKDSPNSFYIIDEGNGIDPEQLKELFSLNRGLVTSKQIRLPSRGALGNGLRVVTGAIVSTGGTLIVTTRGNTYQIKPTQDGDADVILLRTGEPTHHTEFYVSFNNTPFDVDLKFARMLLGMTDGEYYKGKTSAHWYTSEAFFQLLTSTDVTVREFVTHFDGVSGKGGIIPSDLKGKYTHELSNRESEKLLDWMIKNSKQVNTDRLGNIKIIEGLNHDGYGTSNGYYIVTTSTGGFNAEIPFTVEAWVKLKDNGSFRCYPNVNRSAALKEISIYDSKKGSRIYGFGGSFDVPLKEKYDLHVNIITPYMPITSDGKAPDFGFMEEEIQKAIIQAAKRAKGTIPKEESSNIIKKIVFDKIPESILMASGGIYRFSMRQLFYIVRPFIEVECGKELKYATFTTYVTDYENEHEIKGMYRDPRGSLYHPHTKQEIPLGTIEVERYQRPDWTFNKVLYCEKEGFISILKEAGFPEKYDCALMSAKGYASRAAKDVIDMLGETEEELTFYCIHDADSSGTAIYESLQEATNARPERKVKIINLGLEPDEAINMKLQVENVDNSKVPCGKYVSNKEKEWLKSHRVELNAMTTPQFIDWLEGKFIELGVDNKIIPPIEVNNEMYLKIKRQKVKEDLIAKILSHYDVEGDVEDKLLEMKTEIDEDLNGLTEYIGNEFKNNPLQLWKEAINNKIYMK